MDSVRIPQMSSQRGCSFPLYFFHTSVPKNEYLFCFCARKTPRKITHPYRNASFPVDSYRTAQQDYDEADVCQRFFLPSLFSPPTSRKLPFVPRAANQSSCSFTTALLGISNLPLLWHCAPFCLSQTSVSTAVEWKMFAKAALLLILVLTYPYDCGKCCDTVY